ncbi:iron complex transport system substrate-binding protein [Nocardiopsis arvandica]|uniref:Iron complex transport system substrate-binding protein n=1 Tax=Nocardiopsis sinuspersici TaxID=501010 RepID=A0A7Y9XF90_9ACTN|nr:iron-siderophore ABC transporter substrate-binding protein [Nocardiopsis sinuspersici]NYH54789.1 iron complex transport system substrate-binding protein [Nocardiopsis sinuspersici]
MNRGPLTRGGSIAAGALSLLLLAACGGQTTGSASEGSDGAAAEGYPVTVETLYGDVTVEDEPANVVATGWSDAETALALGVQPVGVADWQGYGGMGVGPWAADLLDEEPVEVGTMEPNLEAIASLEPDVILDTRSDNSQERYDLLSPVAPVVGPPPGVEVTYGTTWQQQTRQVAQVLGEKEKAEEVIKDLEDRFARISEDNPEFADTTIAVGAYYDGQYGAYVPGDSRVDLLQDLGFQYKSEITEMADGAFYVDLSSEMVEVLDADLTVIFPIGGTAEFLHEDPVLQSIPSAEDGRLIILDDTELANAFSSGSSLGTSYALDGIVPLIQEALKG